MKHMCAAALAAVIMAATGAAVLSSAEAVRALTKAGANVDAQAENGTTPLALANRYGGPGVAQALRDAGARE
ncbi:MAG: hypothetical protein GDA53_10410 [Rhodobacteraceae bacterium]|nr:hypothetical protein [Paracoccaceae bacterium]